MPITGFTGTKDELTSQQRDVLHETLASIDSYTLHHGDCVGADEEAHKIAYSLGYDIVVHPPTSDKHRAWCGQGQTGVEILNPRPYLARNKDIVLSSEILVACSGTMNELVRSGTWSTVRYARSHTLDHSKIYIIFPDGSITVEGGK